MTKKLIYMQGFTALLLVFLAAPASAQVPCACVPPATICPDTCSTTGTATQIQNNLTDKVKDALKDAAGKLETHVGDKTDELVKTALDSINTTELRLIDWWKDEMWLKRLLPDLQNIVAQMHTAVAEQSRALQAGVDATLFNQNLQMRQEMQLDSHRGQRVSENAAMAATVAGGYGRANGIARAMRDAWEMESMNIGTGKKGTSGATAEAEAEQQRYKDYKDLFCDPAGNGGNNVCTGTGNPKYYNADTQPSRFIYDRLTIDVADATDGKNTAKAIATINNNLVGSPSTDPISLGALQSASGQAVFLDRRSYLARHGAVRSVPQLITSWRMPGSQMGQWVKPLREGAGAAASDISANPSYREVMHASTVDRFNSGLFATSNLTDESEIEIQNLTLDAIYLMQLRDYYELMERTALVLAVQVSMMADETPLPDVQAVAPMR